MTLNINREGETSSLRIVRHGCHLHWPEHLARGDKRYRGGPGTVVDLDALCEERFLAGQEFKLRALADGEAKGAAPTPITCPAALGEIESLRRQINPPQMAPKPADVLAENAAAADVQVEAADGPPAPDEPAKKTSRKKTSRKSTGGTAAKE